MVKYIYEKYNAESSVIRTEGTWNAFSGWETKVLNPSVGGFPNYNFLNSGFYPVGDRQTLISDYKIGNAVTLYGDINTGGPSTNVTEIQYVFLSSTSYESRQRSRSVTSTTVYSKGNTSLGSVIAENGTYPTNGRHTDGFWYVRASVANTSPSLSVATTDNRTLYENDTYAVSGHVTDSDVGNVVIVKFSINGGIERAITSAISQGSEIAYNKVLTFKQGKLFDGVNALTETLVDGSQHVLRVWAEDDKGGKSAEQVRVFYVVANRSAVLTINPVAPISDLIDTNSFAISGNVTDPDGNIVSVRYKIGSGLYTQVYSGVGGAFTFNVLLADLLVGVNTITVQATDSYGLSTTKTLRVTKSANTRSLLKSVATYKLTPPNVSADGIVLWVQRETGDLSVEAEISMSANGAAENFVPMVKGRSAYVTDAIEEDEFTFDNVTAAENIVLRLTMTRTSATSDKGIKLISGVLS